jgi:hypothetical protein
MTRASELVSQLQELAKEGRIFPAHLPKSGREITADQLLVFVDRASSGSA